MYSRIPAGEDRTCHRRSVVVEGPGNRLLLFLFVLRPLRRFANQGLRLMEPVADQTGPRAALLAGLRMIPTLAKPRHVGRSTPTLTALRTATLVAPPNLGRLRTAMWVDLRDTE
jgi:hypothetical protein